MTKEQLALLVTAVTIVANLVFAFTGITHSVSCSVTQLTASVYAAMGTSTP